MCDHKWKATGVITSEGEPFIELYCFECWSYGIVEDFSIGEWIEARKLSAPGVEPYLFNNSRKVIEFCNY